MKTWHWIVAVAVVLYLISKGTRQTGQEGNTTTTAVGSNPFWTIGSGWYSQHFPSGAG